MKKNIFSILTLIILFTVSFISSAASSVKLISSGDENNVFETEGTLRFEWTDEDDCDAIDGNSVKLFFIPNNPEDFGRKIVYVWPNDLSDEGYAKALASNPSLQYRNHEEDTLKMVQKIFKNTKIKKNKAGHREMTVKIRLKSLKPKLGCNATLLYSELVNVKEIKAPKQQNDLDSGRRCYNTSHESPFGVVVEVSDHAIVLTCFDCLEVPYKHLSV